jgi:phosphoglycerate dehydrogenase-like enzyme
MADTTLLVVGKPDTPHLRLLERLPREASVSFAQDAALVGEIGARAEVVFCDIAQGGQLRPVWSELRRLRWVHSISAGVDHLLFPELVTSEVVLTNGRGAFKRALAEFVIAAALYFAKDVPRLKRQQHERLWQMYDMEELHGKTLGIVGYGEIGRATAALAKALGMRVLALRRRPERMADDPLVDEVVRRENLKDLMARSDYVLVSAALTTDTRGMVGAAEIQAMPPSAVLINVGRGPVVVESALVEALAAGRIRGAALDVFDVEPLPAEHPFYRLKNVLLSPHTADHVAGWLEQAVEVFLANFGRFTAGETLVNVVDKHAGY